MVGEKMRSTETAIEYGWHWLTFFFSPLSQAEEYRNLIDKLELDIICGKS